METRALSVRETAHALGISRFAVYQAVKTGELPVLKIGKRILIPAGRLNELLECNKDVGVKDDNQNK